MDTKTKTGLWLCRGPALLFAILETRGCLKHTHEVWPGHAQFHQLTGLGYYLGMVLFFFWITGKPFRNKEPWSWWALPMMGLFVHGGHIIADYFTLGLRGGGTSQGSGMMFYYLTILGLVLYLVGAALAKPWFKK
ncbi:hypothetical protein V2O64_00945 [Verrucomicrobiaceae bacterium 227]